MHSQILANWFILYPLILAIECHMTIEGDNCFINCRIHSWKDCTTGIFVNKLLKKKNENAIYQWLIERLNHVQYSLVLVNCLLS